MKTVLLATLLVSSSVALAATPIAGSWKIDGDVQGYPIHETCTLTGSDDTLAGTCAGEKTVPAKASLKGDTFTLTHAGEYQGQPLTLTYTGKLRADGNIDGSIDVQPLNYDGAFTATRSTEPAPAKP